MILVERAGPADASAIARVHLQSSRETYLPIFGAAARFVHSQETREAEWTAALSRGDIAYVARDDGEVVGFCHAAGGRMTTLYLLASHQRRGIGRALFNCLRAALAAQGIAEMRFDVLAKNQNAIGFCEAQGARLVGRHIADAAEGPTEDVVFVVATA